MSFDAPFSMPTPLEINHEYTEPMKDSFTLLFLGGPFKLQPKICTKSVVIINKQQKIGKIQITKSTATHIHSAFNIKKP